MPVINGKKTTAFPGLYVKSVDSVKDAVIQFDSVNVAPTTASGYYYLYVDSNGNLVFDNGSATTILGAAGGASTTWESLFVNDSTFDISSGTLTISQSSANAVLTLNKTNVGAGSVISITNSGTGADISNSTNWSILASGGVGVLELASGGTINATGGALSIGKTGTATTLVGTLTVSEGATVTAGGLTVTSGALTITSGNVTFTNGNVSVASGNVAIVDDQNAASLKVTNNTATTVGASAATGVVEFASTSLTTGTLLHLELTEGTLNGGHYMKAWDITAGAAVFSIAEDGVTTIAGTAGSNSFTLTAGDVVFSDGSVSITDADNASTLTVTNNTITTATLVTIGSTSVTTGTVMGMVNADGLTTGKILSLVSNSSNTSARSLLYIQNDNTAAVGAIPLTIVQDALISTHFKKVIVAAGVTIWTSDGTTANGALSGTAGDICLNAGSNKPEYCTGTTNWTALV